VLTFIHKTNMKTFLGIFIALGLQGCSPFSYEEKTLQVKHEEFIETQQEDMCKLLSSMEANFKVK
jgi:hypothetical protein